jgi:hypothetical protein
MFRGGVLWSRSNVVKMCWSRPRRPKVHLSVAWYALHCIACSCCKVGGDYICPFTRESLCVAIASSRCSHGDGLRLVALRMLILRRHARSLRTDMTDGGDGSRFLLMSERRPVRDLDILVIVVVVGLWFSLSACMNVVEVWSSCGLYPDYITDTIV